MTFFAALALALTAGTQPTEPTGEASIKVADGTIIVTITDTVNI